MQDHAPRSVCRCSIRCRLAGAHLGNSASFRIPERARSEQTPGTLRRCCNRCRVSCKIQERRSSDVRATNTATSRHAQASTSSTAETSTKKSRRSRLSGRQAFLAAAMGLRSDASRSRCHSTTPAPTATPALLGIPARIAPESPYTTAVVQASCYWRVIGVLLACCCVQQAGSPSNCHRARVARNRAAARSHTAPRLPRTPQRMARRTPRRPRAARSTPCTSSLATHPQPPHRPQPQPGRSSPPRRRIPPGTVQRRPRQHLKRPRHPRTHRTRTRNRTVGH